ncbi:MAG: hypothetical protein WC758_07985 [Candidatus Woesearchaeota archaeon]|jgi:hypothetical protein
MGIISSIKSYIKEKKIEKAVEKGKELSKQGVTQSTPRDTSGNYVVSSDGGTKVVSSGGNVIKSYSSGRGGGGSRGGSSGGSSSGTTSTSSSLDTSNVLGATNKKSPVTISEQLKNKQSSNIQTLKGATIKEYTSALPSESKTKVDESYKRKIQVYSPNTIYETQTDTYKRGKEEIPVLSTFYVEEDYSSRPATKEEREYLDLIKSSEAYKEVASEQAPSKIKREFGEAKGKLSKFGEEEFIDVSGTKELSSKYGKVGEVAGGVVTGLVPSTKGELLTTAGALALGGAIGAGIKGGSYILGKIPKVGEYSAKGFKLFGYGAGLYSTGAYGINVATQFEQAEGTYEKSQIIGKATRETGAVILGGYAGSKAVDIGIGFKTTRGRTFLETEQGEYPASPSKTHLDLFKKNVIPELGETSGAFHTTSQKFWKGGEIIPAEGTSELAGLYGSTKVSTPFARISGSVKTKLFPSIQDLLGITGEPSIAYIKPEGFRYGEIEFSKTKIFEGQKRIKGKGYAFFEETLRKGYADVPSIKTEIEAIFRPEAGNYLFESGKYYTKIKNVKVPIDVFKYGETKILEQIKSEKKIGGSKRKVFSSYDYSLPKEVSLVSYEYGLGLKSSYGKKDYSKGSSVKKSSREYIYGSSGKSYFDNYISKVYGGSSKQSSKSYLGQSNISNVYGSSYGESYTPQKKYNYIPKLDLELKVKEKQRTKSQIGKQPTRYQPSLTASALGITSVKQPDIVGLSVRPLIQSSKRKKKNKKRK